MITITELAKSKALELIRSEGRSPETFIRVTVKAGGCQGLSRELTFDNNLVDTDKVFDNNGIKIVCDKRSFLYLVGTELDYSDGLNGKGFEFKIPNAKICSCGESFSI